MLSLPGQYAAHTTEAVLTDLCNQLPAPWCCMQAHLLSSTIAVHALVRETCNLAKGLPELRNNNISESSAEHVQAALGC
jgi:hypothetical protein